MDKTSSSSSKYVRLGRHPRTQWEHSEFFSFLLRLYKGHFTLFSPKRKLLLINHVALVDQTNNQ